MNISWLLRLLPRPDKLRGAAGGGASTILRLLEGDGAVASPAVVPVLGDVVRPEDPALAEPFSRPLVEVDVQDAEADLHQGDAHAQDLPDGDGIQRRCLDSERQVSLAYAQKELAPVGVLGVGDNIDEKRAGLGGHRSFLAGGCW